MQDLIFTKKTLWVASEKSSSWQILNCIIHSTLKLFSKLQILRRFLFTYQDWKSIVIALLEVNPWNCSQSLKIRSHLWIFWQYVFGRVADLHRILELDLEELKLVENDFHSLRPINALQNQTLGKLTFEAFSFGIPVPKQIYDFIEPCPRRLYLFLYFSQMTKIASEGISSALPKLKT